MIMNEVEERVNVGFPSSIREMAGSRVRKGESLLMGGGWIWWPLRARFGGLFARFGKFSFTLLSEEARTSVARGVRIFWGIALARREIWVGGSVPVKRIFGGGA